MKNIGERVAVLLRPYRNYVRWCSIIVNGIGLLVLALWILNIEISIRDKVFEQEPILVALTMFFATLNQTHRWLLNEAEYSPSYSLASGYVGNFISPVVTQLLEDGVKNPKIHIYKPRDFSELFKNNIDRVKAQVQNMGFELGEVNLNLKHSRARDVLTIKKSKTKVIYFDFPNTLLSLITYVDYKVGSKKDSSAEKEKRELTESLIVKFYEKVNELIERDNIQDYVFYCDKEMKLEF